MGKTDHAWNAIMARTKEAMEEDRLMAALGSILGLELRRQMGGFVGLPGYHIEIVSGSDKRRLEEGWRRACERAEAIETPVVLYRAPGKEYRALMSGSEYLDLPVSDSLEYTMNMSLDMFALFCQQVKARQMRALMAEKRFVIQQGTQLQ